MTLADIIILIVVVLLLSSIIYFSIIRPKIKHETGCSKCPYCKQCEKKVLDCNKNKKQKMKNQTKTNNY